MRVLGSLVVVRLVERNRAGQARRERAAWLADTRIGIVRSAEESADPVRATPVPPRSEPTEHQATSRTAEASASARSFFRLWCSIWRIRSRVTLKARPTSSSVRGCLPSRP